MYFDSLTLAAVAEELQEHVSGGRIQRVRQTGPLSIGLEIYVRGKRHQLLASAHPQFARVHLVQAKLSSGIEQATPLLLLLRKYLLGGRITAIEQPPLERILSISIVKERPMRNRSLPTDDDPAEPDNEREVEDLDQATLDMLHRTDTPELLRCELVIEPQERRSNIVLVDDNNLILDSIKRVTPAMSSRVILPRRVYEAPPAQQKRDPRAATAEMVAALRDGRERDLARALVGAFRGLAPQAAREVVFRSLDRTEVALAPDLPWYTIAAQLRRLFSDEWAPCLAYADDQAVAYAPYALSHLANVESQPGISVVLERFYATHEQVTAHSQRRTALQQQLAAARERIANQYAQISGELERAQELERLRWEGEMIFAFLHAIGPSQTALELEGRTITLEPGRSPVEQAQERFKAYEKARSAVADLPAKLQQVQVRLDGLDQLAALLAISDDFAQIEQIGREAEEQGYIRPPAGPSRRPKSPRVRPLQLRSADGFEIVVGRSAGQNDEVTFRIARPDDLWLHVRGIHGAHVVVRSGGRELPEETLRQAAGLAAYFSSARDEPVVEVDMARRSRVRRAPGGPPGLAHYLAERTMRIAPLPPWQ